MPRPRVPPSQRRRAAQACNFCREVKKRCSGTVPCAHCLRRGIGSWCSVSPPERGSGPVGPGPPAAPRPEAQQGPAPSPAGPPAAPGADEGFRPPSPSDSRPSVGAVPGSPGAGEPREPPMADGPREPPMADSPRSRMLLNLRGERVYIGGAASLSFLQLVRGVVAEQIGPLQFSHNAQRDTMLEKESPSCSSNPSLSGVAELDVAAKLAFLRSYRAVTEGFIDVFAPSEMEDALIGAGQTGALLASPRRRAAFELVMAIGAQVESAEAARDVGQQYFRQAQCDAFDGMLEDPDLDVVRSFLLMAFYLLGHCRRNAAFMYLGIATRAAVALGLHSRESYADVTEPKDNLRLRVWLSLRIVDMLANSILGRPAATAGLHPDTKSIVDGLSGATQDDEMKRLVASHRTVSIISGVIDTLYERKELSTPVVEQLLGDMEAWAKELPACLRTAPTSGEAAGSRAQKGVIGSIHVSCLYYFAVTLATRPVLMSTLTAPPASGGPAQSHLASACLEVAVFLVQTCVDARKANYLYGNMCIIKALVFAAGLVLGFEIFAKRTVDYDIEAAFGGARDVLGFLAAQSAQAAHYHDILTLLANAITEKRERAGPRGRSRYVTKIFTVNGMNRMDCVPGSSGGERDSAPAPFVDAAAEDGAAWLSENRTPADSDEFLGWDSLDISQWDSFPFVS